VRRFFNSLALLMIGAAAGLALAAAQAQFAIPKSEMQIGILIVSVVALIIALSSAWRFYRAMAKEVDPE
jgi:hypothetical protein